jgi:hypothetical protein
MLAAVLEAFGASAAPFASLEDIATRFNRKTVDDLGRPMSNKWVGGFLRRRLRLSTMKTDGVYVVSRTELKRANAIARRYGLAEAA